MKTRSALFTFFVFGSLILAACGAPAATEAPMFESPANAPINAAPTFVVEQAVKADQGAPNAGEDGSTLPEGESLPIPGNAAYEITNPSGDLTVLENSNRMIVKNADIRLQVEDTNVAIDRSLQVIGDAGGYIISSRVWYQDYYGNNLKYASVTIGVPVDEFENVMRRLRGLAVQVLDENASGEDVTDQYVDLQSQLTNLEATRARIQEFLKDAKSVDEALRVNQELANIEAQIEQIKGRMNYLSDRAAYSTITINLEPVFPILTPVPTSTPIPTATPVPWKPAETFEDASGALTVMYQGIANFLIWMLVAVAPVVLPPVLILWALWKWFTRKAKSVK